MYTQVLILVIAVERGSPVKETCQGHPVRCDTMDASPLRTAIMRATGDGKILQLVKYDESEKISHFNTGLHLFFQEELITHDIIEHAA